MALSLVNERHMSHEMHKAVLRTLDARGQKFSKPMNDVQPIDDFLASSLRLVRSGQDASWSLAESSTWERTWDRIEYHGIAFLFNSHRSHLKSWPTPLLERMVEEARLIALWETTHRQALVQIIGALSDAGINTVLMKGTALAYSLHEEPATRRRGDTDLLIKPKDLGKTRKVLQRLGWYRREDPHGLYYQEGWLHDAAGFFIHSIDLHWEPSDRPVLQEILPLSAFFADRRAMPELHPSAFRPDPALMILHATINQKWHALHGYHSESGKLTSPRRLIWSVDLWLLCQGMNDKDWLRLESQCEVQGVGALVAEALRGMELDLHEIAPDAAMARLEACSLGPALANYFANPDSLTQFWIDLRASDSFRKKTSLILVRAFPPREHLLEKYPAAAKWPTVLLQGRLMLETAGRALRKASLK